MKTWRRAIWAMELPVPRPLGGESLFFQQLKGDCCGRRAAPGEVSGVGGSQTVWDLEAIAISSGKPPVGMTHFHFTFCKDGLGSCGQNEL